MTNALLLDHLLALPDLVSQQQLLTAHAAAIDDALIDALKQVADRYLRADAQRSLAVASLIHHAATLRQEPLYRALALFAEANVYTLGGLGEHQRAVACCEEAAAIYAAAQRPLDQADAQVTKIFALAMLGRYPEALTAGAWASEIFAAAGEWLRLATIFMNVAIVYGRMGNDRAALEHFEQAGRYYRRAGADGEWSLPGVEMNRALVLRNLGRFDESLAANHQAITLLTALGQHAEVGHAQQTMAFTYYVQGRYNEALTLLYDAYHRFQGDGRDADLLVTELYLSQCLLTLRRFADVIATCDDLCRRAAHLGQRFEEGYALLNKALAQAGLGLLDQALDVLTAARAVFTADTNAVWAAQAELEGARLLLLQGRAAAALVQAERCAALFAAYTLPVHQATALLEMAQAYLQLGQPAQVTAALASVVAVAKELPHLHYRAEQLLGQVAEAQGDDQAALLHYDQALLHLEQLRGRLMIEHRANFVEDKEAVYGAAVRLSVARADSMRALAYAERARSQALRELLAQRLDLRIQPRSPADQALVDELVALQGDRDLIYRRLHAAQGFLATADTDESGAAAAATTALQTLEQAITTRWHQLLIRNADYARDSVTEQPHQLIQALIMQAQATLPADTLLLSYYVSQEGMHLFLVTATTVTVHPLAVPSATIQRLVDLWRLNLKMVAASAPGRQGALLANANQILHQLYRLLLAPVAPRLAEFPRLIIVPHGVLHYVPFQALVTTPATAEQGAAYLLDQHEISYLPGVTFLLSTPRPQPAGGLVALGHSYGGRLPQAGPEAQAIAALAQGHALIEAAATKAALRTLSADAQILHLATHGDFRADNPLFSGLALADGWLSTLDIFDLRIHASLVTLSACQTGRNVVGGGDELLGLMRAFLAAGATSLVLSMWAVHDASTAHLMQHFYQTLFAGATKATALRTAQRALRKEPTYAHPYFWAPFLLVGARGVLAD